MDFLCPRQFSHNNVNHSFVFHCLLVYAMTVCIFTSYVIVCSLLTILSLIINWESEVSPLVELTSVFLVRRWHVQVKLAHLKFRGHK